MTEKIERMSEKFFGATQVSKKPNEITLKIKTLPNFFHRHKNVLSNFLNILGDFFYFEVFELNKPECKAEKANPIKEI